MTDIPTVSQKSLRIQLPSGAGAEAPSLSPPALGSPSAQSRPKSILKNRSEGASSPLTTTAELDPLQSESYFQGPFRTLIASIENANSGLLSTHDITEAYVLLSCRIESQAANLGDDTTPAVAVIRTLPSRVVCAAIRRDVVVAISSTQASEDESSDQERMVDERRSHAKDHSSLCHACLRFLVNFFRFPSLHGFLKLHELAWILKETIDIGLSQDLVTINPQKTYSHVIAVISNQRLPDSVLRPLRAKLTAVVERATSGDMRGNTANGPHVAGLKAVYDLLYRHGRLLFHEFNKVLKIILQNLVCPVPAFRDLAAKSLAGFAHAILRSEIPIEDQLKSSSIVGSFIDKEVRREKNLHKHDSNGFVLRDFMKLREDDPHVIQRVTRLLNITSSLLILSGPHVFSRPNSLKFLVKAVGKSQPFRQREVNQLRAATWSCLVRAYGMLSFWDTPKIDGLEESAFKVIRQEYREDVGISVIAVLLGPFQGETRSLNRVREAVTYLYHLGEMPETRKSTAILFRRLLGGVLNDADSDTCTWASPASVIPGWLSNGSTLDLDPRRLKKALAAVPGADLHTVRILEADELVATWESLVETFQILAIGQLFDQKAENTLQNDALLLWRALLRIQRALDPSFSSGAVEKPVLSCLATTLIAFFEVTQARYPIRLAQSLTATLQLWKILDEELGKVWGAAVAGSIYRRLLGTWQFDLVNGVMSDEWAHLSRTLIFAAPKRTLEVLLELHDIAAERVVWLDMVRHIRFMEHPSKEVISCLLLFPIQATEHLLKDDMDFSYWDILFMLGLMHDDPDDVYSVVSEGIERALSTRTCSDLRRFMSTAVSHASRSDTLPNLALISVTSDYLEEAYPPESHEDNELTQIVPALQCIISTFPSLPALTLLKRGLIPWFQDRNSLIPDAVYNNDILSLYCDLFSSIRKMVPVEDAVVELAELLAAPFARERIPEPAVGPIAFKEFWDDIGPSLDFRSRPFPSVLADCVVSLHRAFGCYIPEWLESQLESQETHSSDAGEIVPPSVEDVESSNLSPVSSDRHARTHMSMATPSRRHDDKVLYHQTPQVSPSVGEPSPLFARAQHGPSTPPSPFRLDTERSQKKRRIDPLRHVSGEPSMSDEDYSLWEIPIASQDAREVQDGEDGEECTPRPSPKGPDADAEGLPGVTHAAPSRPLSPEQRIDRSQTAPATLQPHAHQRDGNNGSQNVHAKLRRTHTTTDVPLDALERIRARLSEDANYMETQDLAQATKLTYDVLGILNGKISEKLENRK